MWSKDYDKKYEIPIKRTKCFIYLGFISLLFFFSILLIDIIISEILI